jgi:GMP synthase (glutamine-hydrolysing)
VRHPFPGPLAVRIPARTPDARLLQEADAIFLDELREAGQTSVSQPRGPAAGQERRRDGRRTYENVVALRAVETHDFMTADWSHLPHEPRPHRQPHRQRVRHQPRGLRLTSKPPATIEWE